MNPDEMSRSVGRLLLAMLVCVALVACGGRSTLDAGTSDAGTSDAGTSDAGISDAGTDGGTDGGIDIHGTWTIHQYNVVCANSAPADTTVTITQSGRDFSFTAPDVYMQGVVFNGTVDGVSIDFASAGQSGIEVPAGDCTYGGSIDPSGLTMSGNFSCECVTGDWSATR